MKKHFSILFAFFTSLCGVAAFLVLMLGLGLLTGCSGRDAAVSPSAPLPDQPSDSLTAAPLEPSQQPSTDPAPASEAVTLPSVQPSAQSTPALEAASQPPVQTSPAPSENGFQAVLLGDAQFFNVETEQNLTVNELSRIFTDDGTIAKAVKFAVVDLDRDGAPEVVLQIQVNEDDAFGFEILHQEDGQIYGHTLAYRSLIELKQDGTFSFSSGAADNGFGSISFSGSVYAIDEIACSQSLMTPITS